MPNPAKLGIALFLATTAIFSTFYVVFNNKKAQFYSRDFSEGDDHLSKYIRRAGYELESQYTEATALNKFASITDNSVYVKAKADLAEATAALDILQAQLQSSNPFRQLNAYTSPPLQTFNSFPGNVPLYKSAYIGLKHNPSYCDLVDTYNLYNPDNIFKQMNFVGDYTSKSLVKEHVFRKIGKDVMPQTGMEMKDLNKAYLDLSTAATAFFTKRVTFHNFYEIGKDFLCNSQMYNHIPGHGILTRKDLNVQMVNDYAKRYQSNQACFNKKMFFPYAYRLNNETECAEFFDELNSQEYYLRRQEEPVTFIIKKGYGAHRASGIYMFDAEKETELRSLYENGKMCGEVKQPLLAQLYIANPLLLDKKNKFDFRMYMLIASVDPFIVYYHDGFLRVSLQPYDKNSSEKAVHFTNTHLSKELFKVARDEEEFQGMNETELRDYQMWTMEQLQSYLLQTGTINDPNWLDNYLRPKFKEAYLHTVRMSKSQFFKHSGVFEMFGLDFLLDEKLNLWFIECNASPQLVGTNAYKTEFLSKMLQDMFEIQYGLLRSRWTRIHRFMKTYHEKIAMNNEQSLQNARAEFNMINTNFFEPEFQVSPTNSWQLIMDGTKQGKEAYMGNIRDECIDDA